MIALSIIFFGSWKFAAIFPIAVYVMNLPWLECIIYINIGGIIGAFVFSYFSGFILNLWYRIRKKQLKSNGRNKKNFMRRNRRIIHIKTKFGFIGTVLLNPILLSIPVSSFLIVKYYGLKFNNILWMIVGQIGWSVVYTYLYIVLRIRLF